MSQVRLEFGLKLEGDFHVGTGYGEKGVADSRQMTDPQGRPMIPKRQFRGLLRDRLEYLGQLYPGLDFCDGEYQAKRGEGLTEEDREKYLCGVNVRRDAVPCALCRIFGSVATERGFDFADVGVPETARVELPEDRKAALAERELVSKAHVTIDANKRRAKGDHLFGIEVARPEGDLESCIGSTPEYNGYEQKCPGVLHNDTVLLIAALRFLRRVGGKRRRGLGRCVVELDLAQSCLTGDLQGKGPEAILDDALKPLLTASAAEGGATQ